MMDEIEELRAERDALRAQLRVYETVPPTQEQQPPEEEEQVQRGGMPFSYTYALAHAPYMSVTWTPYDDTAIIAEMITELAHFYEVHDDMILVMAHDYVPDLGEPMVRFQGVPLTLYFVCYAYYPDIDWPIPRQRMVRNLILQHADPNHMSDLLHAAG